MTRKAHNKNKRWNGYEYVSKTDDIIGSISLGVLFGLTVVSYSIGLLTSRGEVQAVRAVETINTTSERSESQLLAESLGVTDYQSKTYVVTDHPKYSDPIEQYIYTVFGDNHEQALKIARCESGLNPETIGDTHIIGMLDGENIGHSVGIYQIRTGDAGGSYDSKPWNRAKANGMTVSEFTEKLKDYKYNINYAKSIYDRQGWSAWYNCAVKTEVL